MLTSTDIKALVIHEWLTEHAEGFAAFAERREQELRNPPPKERSFQVRYFTLGKVRVARDGAFGIPSAESVAKLRDGSYVISPTMEQKALAVAVYHGGRKNPVDEAEAQALRAQGFHVSEERIPA